MSWRGREERGEGGVVRGEGEGEEGRMWVRERVRMRLSRMKVVVGWRVEDWYLVFLG